MSRTYLRAAGVTAVGLLAAGLSQEGSARALFDSAAVPQEHIAVLAQPIGRAQWKLLVLEQIKAQPRCWRARQDGLVEPSLNRFNFSGFCKRYLDSNGYSLRSGGQDLGTRFRFRLKPSGTSLRLEALDPQQRAPLLVGQAPLPTRRDPNGFVALQLEPGWALKRRVYQGRPLNHLYFAHHDPVNRLLASVQAFSGWERRCRRSHHRRCQQHEQHGGEPHNDAPHTDAPHAWPAMPRSDCR